jgi:hypothetical protein
MIAQEINNAQSFSASMEEGVPPFDDEFAEFAKVLDVPQEQYAAASSATVLGGSDALASLLQDQFSQADTTRLLPQNLTSRSQVEAEPQAEPQLEAEPEPAEMLTGGRAAMSAYAGMPIDLLVNSATVPLEDIRSLPLEAKVQVQEGQVVDAPLSPRRALDSHLESMDSQALTLSPDGSQALQEKAQQEQGEFGPEPEPEEPEELAAQSAPTPHLTFAASDARAKAMLIDGIAQQLPPAAVGVALQLFRLAGNDGHDIAERIELAIERALPVSGGDLPDLASKRSIGSLSLEEEMDQHGLSEADKQHLMEEGVTTLDVFRMLQDEDFEACGIDIAQRRKHQAAKDKAKQFEAARVADLQDTADRTAIKTILSSEGGQLNDAEQAVLKRVVRLSDVCGLRVAQIKASLGLTIADARMLYNILDRSQFVQQFKFRLLDRWLLLMTEPAIKVLQDKAAEAAVLADERDIVAWLYALGIANVEYTVACGDRQLPAACKETRWQKKAQKKALLRNLTESDAAVVEAMITPLWWSSTSSGMETFYSTVISCCDRCCSLSSNSSRSSPSSCRVQYNNSIRHPGSGGEYLHPICFLRMLFASHALGLQFYSLWHCVTFVQTAKEPKGKTAGN